MFYAIIFQHTQAYFLKVIENDQVRYLDQARVAY